MATLTLDQLIRHVQDIPTLPASAMRIVDIADDPNSSTRDMVKVVETDLGFTSRVLRIANSAYYGLSRRVGTVGEAVLVVGMQALRDLAVAAASAGTLLMDTSGYAMARGTLWRHSTAVAINARLIAQRISGMNPAEAFTAGLLHDIGKVVLHEYVAQQMMAILSLVQLDHMPFVEAEKYVLGFDHAETGGHIALKWRLPPTLSGAIAEHHRKEVIAKERSLATVIHVADAITTAEGFYAALADGGCRLEMVALEVLDLKESDLIAVQEEAIAYLESGSNIFRQLAA
jgi:putative nucleotidyltransferase with HDIG domain